MIWNLATIGCENPVKLGRTGLVICFYNKSGLMQIGYTFTRV